MKVSVIGTGTMGLGISQLLCSNEKITSVVVVGRTIEKASNLSSACEIYLKKSIAKGRLHEKAIENLKRNAIFTDDLEEISDSDFVIEAVKEDYLAKKEIAKRACSYLKKNSIFASNTSSLSITEISSALPYPSQCIGLHFFNPAPAMNLVEIITGQLTSQEVIEKSIELAKNLNKTPVVAKEAPGFIVNRMLIPMINEAISILGDGISTAEEIDSAMKLGANHPMGPLSLSDLIGNDVTLSIMESLHNETGDPKYRSHPLLRKLVRANHLGRKTGKGFFEY